MPLNLSLTGSPSRGRARSLSTISVLTIARAPLGAIPPSGVLARTLSPGCVDVRSVMTPEAGATIRIKLSLSMFSKLIRDAGLGPQRRGRLLSCRRSFFSESSISFVARVVVQPQLAELLPASDEHILGIHDSCFWRAANSVTFSCATW